MFASSKPRQYSYISHKDSIPLQIKGNMKKKVNASRVKNQSETITFGIKSEDRRNFINKITTNYEDLKSIVPGQNEQKTKTQKIKTFARQKHIGISGVAYLNIKSAKNYVHPQKKHISNVFTIQSIKDSRKSEKKHYNQKQIQSEKQVSNPKPHTQTLNMRLSYDMYSSFNRKNNQLSQSMRRNPQKNASGYSMGYQYRKSRPVSQAKMRQISGQYKTPIQNKSKVMRDDWRKSSIIFG